MSSEHIELRRMLRDKSKDEFFALLNKVMLSDEECKMMTMYYCERKPLGYIADELGYSEVGITKLHNRVLKRIGKVIADR